ncbi:MAG: 2,3-bisphosphoglycerate-dependent phosphoglycerate mutase [Planctomycetota bacterium]
MATQILIGRRPALLAAVACLSVMLCGAALKPSGQAGAQKAESSAVSIFIVRHAEKGTDDPRNPSLSAAGAVRAQEVARMFAAARVTHLFATGYKRTQETLAPLAEALGIEVATYEPGKLVGDLRALAPGSVAVVAGHSNTSPALYKALGAGPGRALIPKGEFDRLYSVTLVPGTDGELEFVAGVELRYGAHSGE